jgi:hypothetical protein
VDASIFPAPIEESDISGQTNEEEGECGKQVTQSKDERLEIEFGITIRCAI